MSETPDTEPRKGQIDGTNRDDLIDDQFLDDPDNDRVDGGAEGADDTIFGGVGEDTIVASGGSDVIDGGAQRDTYIVGPIVLGDPVVTTAAFTLDDLSATGYPLTADAPFAIKRLTLETGLAVIGDDDDSAESINNDGEATLGGANLINTEDGVSFFISELPTLGTLYVDFDPTSTSTEPPEWITVAVNDEIPTTAELIWILTDTDASSLSPQDRSATFEYRVEISVGEAKRSVDADVTIGIPNTTPVADPVLAVAERSDGFLGGIPEAEPAYDINFEVVFGDGALDGDEVANNAAPENAGDGIADLGAEDEAGSSATPVFEILTPPKFGKLYIDERPNETFQDWLRIPEDATTFTDVNNLRWVIEDSGPDGVAAALASGEERTTFTYRAVLAGNNSEPATVTIDLSNLELINGSVADEVLTSAVQVNGSNQDAIVPTGFPVGSEANPIIQFRSFDLNGTLDGDTREDAPNLGGLSINDVPFEELTFRIASLPEVGSLVVERTDGVNTEFIPVTRTGFELSTTDKLYWAATANEANDLPADGQVLFNYVVFDNVGPASTPAVVRVDVLQADPVRTFVDEVPEFSSDFADANLGSLQPFFFKSIDVGVGSDATALDGGINILEPLAGDEADLAAVSGEFGSTSLRYRVTDLPETGSLWLDKSGGLQPEEGFGPGLIPVNLETVLVEGDKLYWLAGLGDFDQATDTTFIGNPLIDDGDDNPDNNFPQIQNIPIEQWESPENSDLRITYTGRDFDGSPARVVTLPVDGDGNVLLDSEGNPLVFNDEEYRAFLQNDARDPDGTLNLGSPIVKTGIGLSGESPGTPLSFEQPPGEGEGANAPRPIAEDFFYNTEAEIDAGFGEFAQASQTLVASFSNPVVGDKVFVSLLYEFEGEFGLVEAFLDGEQVGRIYFGYPNPFDGSLPEVIQKEVNDEIALFQSVTALGRPENTGDGSGDTRPDEGEGLGRFELKDENGEGIIFDQLEFSALNSGLIFADPTLSTDTSDFRLHALEVREFESIDSVEFAYSAIDGDDVASNPATILIETDPPRADPVTTNWEASYVDSDQPDGSITTSGDGRFADGRIAYEKIFTVNDLLDGDGLEPGPTTESIPSLGGRVATLVSPAGGNAASLGGTIPSDGTLIYTIESLPDFGVLQIGTDENGSGIIGGSEYKIAQVGDTFTSENQLRHVVSIADLDAEYKPEDEGGTNLRRGGFADFFRGEVNNRDLLKMAAFSSDQTVADAYVNIPEDRDIGDEFTSLAKSYVQLLNPGGRGSIAVLAGEPDSDRDADGLQTIFPQNRPGGGFRDPDRISYYEDPDTGEGSSEGLIINFGDPVSHTLVRTGTTRTDLVREETSATIYAKVDLYLNGLERGSLIVGSVVVDQQLKDQYEAQRLAAEASGEVFEPTVPNGVDIFAFTEVGNIETRPGSLFQISNEQLLNDGSRLGLFDTMVITNQGSASSRDPSEFDGLKIVGVRFMRGETSFSYSVTDSETGVKSTAQLVTIGTEAGETLFADDVKARFPSEPAVQGPTGDTALQSIVLSVGGGLDGGITTPEPFQSANLGALSSKEPEDSLNFFIKTLPKDAKLFLDRGGDNPDDPDQWEEITSDNLFIEQDGQEGTPPSSSPISFGTSDKIYVIVSSKEEIITAQEIRDGTVSRDINDLSDASDTTEPGFRSYILAANQTEQKEDGSDFRTNLGVASNNSLDNSGPLTVSIRAGSEGEPIDFTTPTAYPVGEETEGFGASQRLVVEFPDVVSRADFVLDSLSGRTGPGESPAELGLVSAFRGDQVVGQFYFGMRDPEDDGGPTNLDYIPTTRTENAFELSQGVAILRISQPGLAFDRLELSAYGFSNGARTLRVGDNRSNTEEFVAGFNARTVFYYRADVEFDYTVQAPDGRTADGTVAIEAPPAVDAEPIRVQVRNADATVEGGRAFFTVETLNGPVDTDTFITLDVIDRLPYDGAPTFDRADSNDWSDDTERNGDPARNDKITVLIRAGGTSGEASIRVESDNLVELDEFLHVTISEITKEGGRDVIAQDDSGVLRIVDAGTGFSVQDIDLVVDPTPTLDPPFLTDRNFGEVLFWRRFEVDENDNPANADVLTAETLDTVLSQDFKTITGLSENDIRFSFLENPDWGSLFAAGDLEFENQDQSIPRITAGLEDAQRSGELFYWAVSRNDRLPDDFTSNPGLFQEVGGADATFDSLEDWETRGLLRVTAFDEDQSPVDASFGFTFGTDGSDNVTRIGVDGGGDDANDALISSGDTPGTSEILSIEYTGPTNLVWAEIDLDDFATQGALENGHYEIAKVTVFKDDLEQATYFVGDGSPIGSPAFAIEFGSSASFGDDRLNPRWIETGDDGRFVIGGFDFDEIQISSYGFSDDNPLDDNLNPVETDGIVAGFSLSSVSYLRDEDLITGQAPSVSFAYQGSVVSGFAGTSVRLNSTPGTINISLSEDNSVSPTEASSPEDLSDTTENSAPEANNSAPPLGSSTTDETVFSPAEEDPPIRFDTIDVFVDDSGSGSVTKFDVNDDIVGTDTVSDIQNFVAAEDIDENDRITLTTGVAPDGNVDVPADETAIGTFMPRDGSGVVNFGPGSEPLVLLSTLLEENRPGSYQITDGAESGTIGNISFSNFEAIDFRILCFARGTNILTKTGNRAVETINAGDKVWTLDDGFETVIWHGVTRVRAEGSVAPVLFKPGFLGNERPLIVSPQHRILLGGSEVELYAGSSEALAPAKMLVDGENVQILRGGVVEYHHILLERHNILLSENVFTESFFPGEESWMILSDKDRRSIQELCPSVKEFGPSGYGETCRPCLKQFEVAVLKQSLTMPDQRKLLGELSDVRNSQSETTSHERAVRSA